jgi:hypothetical protein
MLIPAETKEEEIKILRDNGATLKLQGFPVQENEIYSVPVP